jgi:hypothetical protein
VREPLRVPPVDSRVRIGLLSVPYLSLATVYGRPKVGDRLDV